MIDFPTYNEQVLNELELIDFPQLACAACELGVPDRVVAEYISLMARAFYLQHTEPSVAAKEIAFHFMKQFESAMINVVMNSKFPSE